MKSNQRVPKKTDWRINETFFDQDSAYFGVIYLNHKTDQLVLAHRGTNTFASLVEDAKGIYLNRLSPHKAHVYALTQSAMKLAQEEGYTQI